ncbi:MAG: DUF3142 domain-containing protein [Acinetobacter sp.]|uniref:DUF3142 domain-containing protein n=1 Tax=Acinetobacter sp. TaxID=472 RepID=UPI0026DFC9BD|nr:DUF3142 domain-containing protein [Acinetobacter sp.]MDO5542723.1 DUF3142 domain-containing protein [Acinetobacter sp.]
MPKHAVRLLMRNFALLCMNILLCACTPQQTASKGLERHIASTSNKVVVDAADYSSFWIWGNISSATYLQQAKELYILQGEIKWDRTTQRSEFRPQGISILKKPNQSIWLVVRSYHLNWSTENIQQIIQRLHQWESQDNQIEGLQIDFDARTKNIQQYAEFLAKFRQHLPKQYRLGITGLLDWTNVRNQTALALLRQNIDEIAIQTYQGSTTIPNYANYLAKISQLKLPYKIGVVQHGQWQAPSHLTKDPNFKGYIVFLLRQRD